MHQTFYIDIDEEITSIVEKLRKTEAPEAVLVVPKRALLIQSIVNLKLLRKEADNLGLKISIVTQDKLGKLLTQKAGIFVQQKVLDSYDEADSSADERNQPKRELEKEIETVELDDSASQNKRRLEKMGSADFFISEDGSDSFSDRERDWQELEKAREEKPPLMNDLIGKKKIAVGVGNQNENSRAGGKKRNVSAMDVSPLARPFTPKNEISLASNVPQLAGNYAENSCEYNAYGNPARNAAQEFSEKTNCLMPRKVVPVVATSPDPVGDFPGIPYSKSRPNYLKDDPVTPKAVRGADYSRDEQLEKFFYASNFSDKNKEDYVDKKRERVASGGNKLLRAVAILGAIIVSGGLLYGAFLYVPKATIMLSAKKEVKSSDLEIMGDVNSESVNYEKSTIPAKLLEFDEDVAKTFNATGKKNASNQKAKGKITIYNEFSSSSQPLVATTRFMTDDQKVFRLVQGVTIPGTTKVGDEIKPGVVEAEVVADEAGSGYNIGVTNFSIPGFKNSGNDKYTKIYAKSSVAMSGGGDGNEEVVVVTAKDISDAKDKISLDISSAVKQKVKESADAGTIILDDAISIDEPVYRLSNSEGETTDSFEIKVSAHARALVFSESDVKKIANSVISKSGNGKINIDSGSVIIDYGKAVFDLKAGTIDVKLHASNVAQPNLDLDNLKKGLLGKTSDELADYLKTYPSIEKAEVEYWPPIFVSKIPLNEKRVDVVLDATMPE